MFSLYSLQQHIIYSWTQFPFLGQFLPHFVKSATMQYSNVNIQNGNLHNWGWRIAFEHTALSTF